MLLILKARQIQAGANWDSVKEVTVGVLLFAGIAFILLLLISRIVKWHRLRSGVRSRRRRR